MAEATGTLTRTGTFVWEELITGDVAAGRAFYQNVLGWTSTEQPLGDDAEAGTYTMFTANGQGVGGAFELNDVPPHWGTYIGVDSADDAIAQAKELGATVLREPMDVMEHGRMGTILDPTGAVVSVWESNLEAVREPVGHGTVCWREIRTRDLEQTKSFYGAWMGWTFEARDMGEFTYWIINLGERQVGGVMPIIPEMMGDMPSHWGVIFEVADCDAVYEHALQLGAVTLMEPDDIPEVGRYAGLKDPTGAAFGVLMPADS
jgi:predicted enzyme related to lactoylglutathione lyase